MTPFFIALTVTDVLLLILLVTLPVRVAWWAKLAAIAIVLSLNFLTWNAMGTGSGWPATTALPADGQYVACEVIEPDVASQEPGAIYVWVIPLTRSGGLLSYRPNSFEPRAYREPYDRSLHVACENAKAAGGHGIETGIHRIGRGGPHGTATGTYRAYVLPSVKLPTKGEGK